MEGREDSGERVHVDPGFDGEHQTDIGRHHPEQATVAAAAV